MTMNEVEQAIHLNPIKLFDHKDKLKEEIQSFQPITERNEHEFVGLIKKNHMVS